jgi:hypothetical protein
MKKINDLPKSEDEVWEGEKYVGTNIKIPICGTHGKNWMSHEGYVDNKDGTASCKYCGWGFIKPGYIRIHEGKVFDLRKGQ